MTNRKFLSEFLELASQFDLEKNFPERPKEVPAGTPKKKWWLCELGHSWQASVSARCGRGQGCPFCSGRRAVPGANDLATLFPALATEWSPRNHFPASEATPFTNKTVWWIGRCGHEFQGTISGRTKQGNGCPFCSGHRVLPGFNDLASVKPEVAKEWHPTMNQKLPTEFTWASNRKAWFRCDKGHEWETAIRARTSNGSGCPFCSGNKVVQGETDLLSSHPLVAASWDFSKNKLKPQDFSHGSTEKAWWICKAGHSWRSAIYTRKKQGCPTCAGRKVQKGFNDLESQRPEFLSNWSFERNSADPSTVSMNSHHKFWWTCDRKHSYYASVSSQKRGRGCPVCTGREVRQGVNDLASQMPELAREWSSKNYPLEPTHITLGSGKKVWWLASCGHEFQSVIGNRAKGVGCPICDGKEVLKGFNDLASQRPDLLKRWHPTRNTLLPTEIVVGSVKKVWWVCPEGHEWQSTPSSQASGHDCPSCALSGFRSSLPAMFYLLENVERSAAKVGITNLDTRNSRLGNLSKLGFVLVKSWQSKSGNQIRELEKRTLQYLRHDLGLPPYLAKEDMGPTAGWKETFSHHAIDEFKLISWIEQEFSKLQELGEKS